MRHNNSLDIIYWFKLGEKAILNIAHPYASDTNNLCWLFVFSCNHQCHGFFFVCAKTPFLNSLVDINIIQFKMMFVQSIEAVEWRGCVWFEDLSDNKSTFWRQTSTASSCQSSQGWFLFFLCVNNLLLLFRYN